MICGRARLEDRPSVCEVFFAHPYHSWEWRSHCGRGTNENTNGLIRRLYPKKPSFSGIGEAELLCIESFLNDRPRKCLGWATPRERIAVTSHVVASLFVAGHCF